MLDKGDFPGIISLEGLVTQAMRQATIVLLSNVYFSHRVALTMELRGSNSVCWKTFAGNKKLSLFVCSPSLSLKVYLKPKPFLFFGHHFHKLVHVDKGLQWFKIHCAICKKKNVLQIPDR